MFFFGYQMLKFLLPPTQRKQLRKAVWQVLNEELMQKDSFQTIPLHTRTTRHCP